MEAEHTRQEEDFYSKLATAGLLGDWSRHRTVFDLCRPVLESIKGQRYWPRTNDIFNAFRCGSKDVKVVILGQDPYHDGSATGRAFDNNYFTKLSPSLKNILAEIKEDSQDTFWTDEIVRESVLEHLTEQGVLLLNTALTVEHGKPGSHTGLWKPFTEALITSLQQQDNIVWILWGNHAKSFKHLITNTSHYIIEGGHPSPLNTSVPFRGGKYFSKANNFLSSTNQTQINW